MACYCVYCVCMWPKRKFLWLILFQWKGVTKYIYRLALLAVPKAACKFIFKCREGRWVLYPKQSQFVLF